MVGDRQRPQFRENNAFPHRVLAPLYLFTTQLLRERLQIARLRLRLPHALKFVPQLSKFMFTHDITCGTIVKVSLGSALLPTLLPPSSCAALSWYNWIRIHSKFVRHLGTVAA